MTREETLSRLRDLAERARELREATDSPTLARSLQTIELTCEIARWGLGEVSPPTARSS